MEGLPYKNTYTTLVNRDTFNAMLTPNMPPPLPVKQRRPANVSAGKHWQRMNRDKIRDNRRKSVYGIPKEEWEFLFNAQGRCCAICKRIESVGKGWHLDHDHSCCPKGRKVCGDCVRGILCQFCNHGLGGARDNIDILFSMIDYLDRYNKRK